MRKERVMAFSDGILAIVITIMVFNMKPPRDADIAALKPIWPAFVSYLLSFVFLGIYWNNYHHLWHTVVHVNGAILWANLHLLFWLSLVPFTTGWMGENNFAATPVALYGVVLILAAVAYYILTHILIRYHGRGSVLARAIGSDFKGKISIVIYATAVAVSFAQSLAALCLYVVVAVMWLVPDRRIEKVLPEKSE